jgi:hypothetical protein
MCSAVLRPPGEEVAAVVDAFERREDVLGVVAIDAVEVKVGGIELGHQAGPLLGVPLVEPPVVFLAKAAAGEAAGLTAAACLRPCR